MGKKPKTGGKERRPMDYHLQGSWRWDSQGWPRSQRWPKQVAAKRKFDGKWYTLEYVDKDKKSAETFAQEWREGGYIPEMGRAAFYARVVPFDDWGIKGDVVYLVYMRPKPLSPEEKARNRKEGKSLKTSTFWDHARDHYPSRLPKKIAKRKKEF